MATQSESYPARLDIDYPEKLDRLTSFFRLIWAIPILIVLSVISATSTSTVTVVTRTGEVVSRATSTGGGIAAALFGATLLADPVPAALSALVVRLRAGVHAVRGPGRRLPGSAHRSVSLHRRGADGTSRDRLPRC